MVAVEFRMKQVFPNLMDEWKTVGGNMWVAVEDGSCDGSQFSSTNGICDAHSIWLNEAGGRGVRVVCPCIRHLVSLIDLTAAVCVSPLLPARHFSG